MKRSTLKMFSASESAAMAAGTSASQAVPTRPSSIVRKTAPRRRTQTASLALIAAPAPNGWMIASIRSHQPISTVTPTPMSSTAIASDERSSQVRRGIVGR